MRKGSIFRKTGISKANSSFAFVFATWLGMA
jgi:hypothetical protein